MDRKETVAQFKKIWERYRYVLLVAAAGVILMIWPFGTKETETVAVSTAETEAGEMLQQTEARMEEILSKIRDVGELHLMLTVERDKEEQLARDTELSYSGDASTPEDYQRKSEIVLTDGDNGDAPVVTGTTGPVYRGALVVCQGAGDAQVRLSVTNAVAALTGLSADRITVIECQ